MSGHSKWHSIKHAKGAADAARGKLFARLARIVFGAPDPKTGACGSVVDMFANETLNHHAEVEGGVLAEETGNMLRRFFAERRALAAAARRAPEAGPD